MIDEPIGRELKDTDSARRGQVHGNSFLDRWLTDVEPVHERTERSRRFRAQYAQLALRAVFVSNGAALIVFPAVARMIDAPIAANMQLFLIAEGSFFAGVILILVAMLLSYVTLDVDVTRQKGERAAARTRLIDSGFPEQFGDALEAEQVKSEAQQNRHWKIGVRLSYVTILVGSLSLAACVVGGVCAGLLLAATAG